MINVKASKSSSSRFGKAIAILALSSSLAVGGVDGRLNFFDRTSLSDVDHGDLGIGSKEGQAAVLTPKSMLRTPVTSTDTDEEVDEVTNVSDESDDFECELPIEETAVVASDVGVINTTTYLTTPKTSLDDFNPRGGCPDGQFCSAVPESKVYGVCVPIPTSPPSSLPVTEPPSTTKPSILPAFPPSVQPVISPTSQPSAQPVILPSAQPVILPSAQPSVQPSAEPSAQPSSQPVGLPSAQPSAQPSAAPTPIPSAGPSSQPSAQPSQDLLSGLIHRYRANRNTIDSVGSADGVPGAAASYSPGITGQAFNFDGLRNSTITLPIDINPSNHPQLTMGLWFNPRSTQNRGWVISHDNGGFDRSLMLFDERFGGVAASVGSSYTSSLSSPAVGVWQCAAVAFDAVEGQAIIYFDGQSQVVSYTPGPGTSTALLGGNPTFFANDNFDGLVDEVFVYDRVLSSVEMENACDTFGTQEPTVQPSVAPSTSPTSMPSAAPSPMPSAAPSPMPSAAPSPMPSAAPSPMPSAAPSPMPSAAPTSMPSRSPTGPTVIDLCANVVCSNPSDSCDPMDGQCRSFNQLIPGVAVIDEADNNSDAFFDNKWATFRARFPNRPFCLLQPSTNPATLHRPAAFLADPRARTSLVNRDGGTAILASDWYTICDLNSLLAEGIQSVGLFIDNSGSMRTSTVQASYDKFLNDLQANGLAFQIVTDPSEDWIEPFLVDFVPV